MHRKLLKATLCLVLVELSSGCLRPRLKRPQKMAAGDGANAEQQMIVDDEEQLGEGPGQDRAREPAGLSLNSNVKWKSLVAYTRDLQQALELNADELCKEYNGELCLDQVHRFSMGGVDAYDQAIFFANPEPAINSPIIAERVVLSACTERAKRDLSGAGSVIYKSIAVAANGAIQDMNAAAVTNAIKTLYQRALIRDPNSVEIETLRSLHGQLQAKGSKQAAMDWATLSCFAVLTSVEFNFY